MLAATVLLGTGVVMSYSTTAPLAFERVLPPLFVAHASALAAGLGAAALAAWAPLGWLRAAALPLWALGLALLVATDVAGVEVNGAQRWLALPGVGFRFQPVELVKIATLLAVVNVVARREGRDEELPPRRALVALAIAGAPVLLLVRQPDFGNAVLIAALAALLLVAAGTRLRRLVAPGLVAALAIAAYVAARPYAMRRVVGFLDPWKDRYGAGFQLVQSFVAFGKGGVFGLGLGAGRQKLAYLPEGKTDFILALVAEELGLLGVLVVLGAFAALWVAGARIARRAKDRFSLLLALAMTSLLTVPAMINAAVVMGLVPTKGLTLPFLSHGGTSLVASCAVLGVLLGIGRRTADAPRGRRA
ncbi:MAG: FtsW/RodA/SpoVE family cell cycle protein [Myxococcota bacterium]